MGPGSVLQYKPQSESKVNSDSDTQQRHSFFDDSIILIPNVNMFSETFHVSQPIVG